MKRSVLKFCRWITNEENTADSSLEVENSYRWGHHSAKPTVEQSISFKSGETDNFQGKIIIESRYCVKTVSNLEIEIES